MKLNDNQNRTKIKHFGYIVSAVGIVLANVGMIRHWSFTPIIVLITMYFLGGSIWFPKLIKPFYLLYIKILDMIKK